MLSMVAIGLCVLLAVFCTWYPTTNPSTGEPTTRPPGGEPTTSDPPPPSASSPPVKPQEERLHIWLRHVTRTRFVRAVPGHPFDEVWPRPTDRHWDTHWLNSHDATHAIRDLSGPGTPFKNRRGARALATARADGFGIGAPVTTPEEALLELYTAWVETEVRYQQDWRDFEAQHLPGGLRRSDLHGPAVRALYRLPDAPRMDVSGLRVMADRVLDAWPDHPVSDHARLALLRATIPLGDTTTWDAEHQVDVLEAIASPTLRERGALLLTATRTRDQALLDAVFATKTFEPIDDYRLASWGMARAVASEDWPRARAWSNRARVAIEQACDQDTASAVSACEFGTTQLRETTARLVALGLTEPSDYKEALTAVAWHCHLDAPAAPGTSRTQATWTGTQWSFAPWDNPGPITTCLQQRAHEATIVPAAPLQLVLTVEASE